jgi:hypothetical protein
MRVGTSSLSLCAKALNVVLRFRYGYRATYALKPYALRALPFDLMPARAA